jgi:hypothetical protein
MLLLQSFDYTSSFVIDAILVPKVLIYWWGH